VLDLLNGLLFYIMDRMALIGFLVLPYVILRELIKLFIPENK